MADDGKLRLFLVFGLALDWRRTCEVRLVGPGDVASFTRCQVNAFEYPGGIPRSCLNDNPWLATLVRDRRA